MSRLIKRKQRRTKAQTQEIREAIYRLVAAERPMTVRQVFYRLVSLGVVGKTEAEYKNTVGRLLVDMRRKRQIPYQWITDNTRLMRKPESYASLEDALRHTAEFYRRDLWGNQAAYVEVWLEKDALSGVLYEVTKQWDVPLMITKGFSSLSFLHSAAEAISYQERPCYLYYFGDYDPSGLDIPRQVEQGLRELAPEAEIHFQRVAVNHEQIATWNLPTRPTKRTDSRSRGFEGESVEVDAIPPVELRQLARRYITQHIDEESLNVLKRIEYEERATLNQFARHWDQVEFEEAANG